MRLIALSGLATSLTMAPQFASAQSILIKDVTVIDATGRAAQPHMTVLIANGHIADVASGKQFKLPPGTEVIDGAGKFLIPGLWNMHVHLLGYEQATSAFPKVLAAGVTSVRDMGSPLTDALRVRAQTQNSTNAPRLTTSGPLLVRAIPPSMKGTMMLRPVAAATDAAEAVSALKAAEVDFIKVEGSLTRDAYLAIAAAARAQQIPFVGHVPPSVSIREASDLGQRSIEHLGGPQYQALIACSTRGDELRARMSAIFDKQVEIAFAGGEPEPEHQRAAFTKMILETFDDRKATALIALFKKNRTWHTPTLGALRSVWNEPKLTAEDREYGEQIQSKQFAIVAAMARSGVPLLAGTDGPLSQAGPALHHELALLVKAGLSPMQALQTATRNPAELAGRLRDLGTIERGKIADLVLLDGDPLADIANTRRVSAVLRDGRMVSAIQPSVGPGPSTTLRTRP